MASNGVGRPAEAKIHVHVKCEYGKNVHFFSFMSWVRKWGHGKPRVVVVALWYGTMRGGGFQQEKEAYSAPINIPFPFFPRLWLKEKRERGREGNIRSTTHIPPHSSFPRPNRRFPRRGKKKCSFPTSSSSHPPLETPSLAKHIIASTHWKKERIKCDTQIRVGLDHEGEKIHAASTLRKLETI